MDVTIFKPLDHSRACAYFIVDKFSRAFLNWETSFEYIRSIALKLLKGSISKYGIMTKTKLLTDGGPVNHGEVSNYIADNSGINHLIAKKDII